MNAQNHRRLADKLFDIGNYTFMIGLSLLFLYPFWDLLMLSLTAPAYVDRLGLRFWAHGFNLDSYRQVFRSDIISYAYANTVFRTVVGAGLTVLVTLGAAFALSQRKLPLRNTITLYILLTMFFQGGLIPSYLNMKSLGLIGSKWSLILPSLANAWYIILARNFLMTFPKELEESAIVDGANPLQVAYRILLPLSMPIVAVIALWSAVSHWNAWFDAMIYLRDKHDYVLQLLVQKILQQDRIDPTNTGTYIQITSQVTSQTIKAATIIAATLPIILVYPFLQKYFVKGVMVGSLKG
ncbi:carbohydrate ABC transporter permease [Paenibacillus aurantius]|uniref:Carbohydrate ABC transporter permease n=1 Tax=Paenibacillus aurantius TaxID=2918900 RepID=A0AA96RF75_9BACL|nr:carbohydrate ABC transporter permease [Paenibacillus aurantius]WNQ13270.1 carbohydrate ABC transporter permease [Paenibacillus aurantius]